jgi:hypothetical protein
MLEDKRSIIIQKRGPRMSKKPPHRKILQPEMNNVDSEIFIVYRTVRMLVIGEFNYFGGPPAMR